MCFAGSVLLSLPPSAKVRMFFPLKGAKTEFTVVVCLVGFFSLRCWQCLFRPNILFTVMSVSAVPAEVSMVLVIHYFCMSEKSKAFDKGFVREGWNSQVLCLIILPEINFVNIPFIVQLELKLPLLKTAM